MPRKSKGLREGKKNRSATPNVLSPSTPVDIESLAAHQGIKPVEDFDQFLDEIHDAWPPGEDVDDFIAAVRKLRREGSDRLG